MLLLPTCAQDFSSRAGRIQHAVLPPEIQLGRLVRNISNPHSTWLRSSPPEEWNGVFIGNGIIEVLRWRGMNLKGTIPWEYLPAYLVTLSLLENELEGTLSTSCLPSSLLALQLGCNQFAGSPDLATLPASLITLGLHQNKFSGKLDLEVLPRELRYATFERNSYHGELCLTSLLPSTLRELDVSRCYFSGFLDLRDLQPMRMVRMRRNYFTRVIPASSDLPFYVHYEWQHSVVELPSKYWLTSSLLDYYKD